jgi:hypothetical protein
MIFQRIFFDILLFLSLFLLPWWVTIILGIVLIFRFKNFYEFIFICFLIDSYFGQQVKILDSYFIFTFIGIFIFIIINKVKENLRY